MDTKNNTGEENTGNRNSGDRNSGNRNSGNWNSGNWNSGDRSERRLSKSLTQTRIEIISKVWEERKSEITMSQLAEIFKLKVSEVYKIFKKARERKTITGITRVIK